MVYGRIVFSVSGKQQAQVAGARGPEGGGLKAGLEQALCL